MKRIPIYLCLVSALLLLGAIKTAPGQETTKSDVSNPFVGTWVLNLDKSSNLSRKSNILKIEAQDNGLKITEDIVYANGRSKRKEYSPKFDGKFYPVIGTQDNTVSLRRINKNSLGLVFKYDPGDADSLVIVFSEDGKVATTTAEGVKEGTNFVYDRQ